MEKITEKTIIGQCYGIGQNVIAALCTAFESRCTFSENLGGTNNHRKYVIVCSTAEQADAIMTAYEKYVNQK